MRWTFPLVCVLLLTLSLLVVPTANSSGPARTFDIRGRGWGHGVGMSQYGAEGFARRGFSYVDILSYYYAGTALGLSPDAAAEVSVGSSSRIIVRDSGGKAFTIPRGNYRVPSSFVLAAIGRRVLLRPPVRFDPESAPLQLDGSAYRGSLVIGRDGRGLYTVNEVPVELYLRGVVPREMPATWHREALRAQAVAARTYALKSSRPGRTFDLYPDTRSQVYGGVAAEDPAATRAVISTAGQVVTWHGRLAVTFFHSSSGGCTAASPDGISGTARLPYLVPAPDPFDEAAPEHRWGPMAITAARLGARLGLPTLTSVRVTRNGSGRVSTLTAFYDGGERTVSGRSFAALLGLPSTWFTVAERGSPEDASPSINCLGAGTQATPTSQWLASTVAVRSAGTDSTTATKSRAAVPDPAVTARARQSASVSSVLRRLGLSPLLVGAAAVGRAAQIRALEFEAEPLPQTPPSAPSPPPLAATPTDPVPKAAPSPPSGKEPAPSPPSTSTEPPAPTPPASPPSSPPPPPAASDAPPPPAPLQIQDVALVSLDSSSARISWRTNFPTQALAARGLHDLPTIFSAPGSLDLTHETDFSGLRPASTYELWLESTDAWGRKETARLELTTPDSTGSTPEVARVGSTLTANGSPFFPVMEWNACPDRFGNLFDSGVNVFMALGETCGAGASLAQLDGRGFSVVDAGTHPVKGSIGFYLPDELDGLLSQDAAAMTQIAAIPPPPADGLTFLTLTNHFFSKAAPPPMGRDIYPPLVSKANVIGFDLYPLQGWCRPGAMGEVYDSQRELTQLAAGKPTYQWIEARAMNCPDLAHAVTPATVRAETWLAIAGGAHGIGFFPNDWALDIDAEISRTAEQIGELAPALLANEVDATSDAESVRAGARESNGATYVVAVNSSFSPTTASIHVPSLAGRPLTVYGEHRTVTAASPDSFTDTFQPLEVHVYVIGPDGWLSPGG